MERKIEAYLVRLCAVQLLPVIPDFCRPFANDSLRRSDEIIVISHQILKIYVKDYYLD